MIGAGKPTMLRRTVASHRRLSRIRNPATRAGDVTEAVDQIIWADRAFHLRKPIDLRVRRRGPYYFVEYEPLGLVGYGRNRQEALDAFADDFSMAWDVYAMARNSGLTGDARDLRRALRALVAAVDAE